MYFVFFNMKSLHNAYYVCIFATNFKTYIMKTLNLSYCEVIKLVHKLRLSHSVSNWHFFIESFEGRPIVSFYVFRQAVEIIPSIMESFSLTDIKEYGSPDDLDYVAIIHYELV